MEGCPQQYKNEGFKEDCTRFRAFGPRESLQHEAVRACPWRSGSLERGKPVQSTYRFSRDTCHGGRRPRRYGNLVDTHRSRYPLVVPIGSRPISSESCRRASAQHQKDGCAEASILRNKQTDQVRLVVATVSHNSRSRHRRQIPRASKFSRGRSASGFRMSQKQNTCCMR